MEIGCVFIWYILRYSAYLLMDYKLTTYQICEYYLSMLGACYILLYVLAYKIYNLHTAYSEMSY